MRQGASPIRSLVWLSVSAEFSNLVAQGLLKHAQSPSSTRASSLHGFTQVRARARHCIIPCHARLDSCPPRLTQHHPLRTSCYNAPRPCIRDWFRATLFWSESPRYVATPSVTAERQRAIERQLLAYGLLQADRRPRIREVQRKMVS